MLSQKLRPPMFRQVIQQNNDDTKITATRISLLVWAFLRLIISSLWTGFLILATAKQLLSLFFGAFALIIQLIEFAMLVTFIVAGLKKNVSLYHAYYWYCILSLIIFAAIAASSLSLGFNNVHHFRELYLFYLIYDASGGIGNDELAFLIYSIVEVGLEMLLIYSIKMLINHYRHRGNKYGENVWSPLRSCVSKMNENKKPFQRK